LYKREEDMFDKLMELSLYDAQNLIQDWMEHGRSYEDPLLNEEDTHSDTPIPSRLVTEGDDSRTLQRITDNSSLANWADETVGDTHIGKRKHNTVTKQGKGKNKFECMVAMMRLLVQDRTPNTKNPTIAVPSPILTMGGCRRSIQY
jgi:hypothetical protein